MTNCPRTRPPAETIPQQAEDSLPRIDQSSVRFVIGFYSLDLVRELDSFYDMNITFIHVTYCVCISDEL